MTFTQRGVQAKLSKASPITANTIAGLLNQTADPDGYEMVQEAQSQTETEMEDWEKILVACRQVLRGFRIKELGNCQFVDLGDLSYPTVIYDMRKKQFYVGSMEDYLST
jgi:hypothetical protein